MSARKALAAAACAAVILAAGCGGDDNGAGNVTITQSSTTGTGGAEKVVVQASKGSFSPEGIYRKVAPGVVTIIAISDGGAADILGGGGGAGQGSGFVVDNQGDIITNAHVVTTGGKAAGGGPVREAKQIFVEFPDHNRVEAQIVGVDPDADVALIKVDTDGINISPITLSDNEEQQVGEPVAAIGSPFGEEQSLSVGVISATDRVIPSLTNFSIDGALQTDAAINPGNSGGPLVDSDGEVIGINQQIESESGSNAGVGFAVPISAVRYSYDQLKTDGHVKYSFIGVTTQSLYPQLADELGLPVDSGALVSNVIDGSPAEDAGLEAGSESIKFQGSPVKKGGDVIVGIDGKPVTSSSDVAVLIADKKPGETLPFEIVTADGERKTVNVTLGTRPEKSTG